MQTSGTARGEQRRVPELYDAGKLCHTSGFGITAMPTRIANRYVLGRCLGKGAMGAVFEAIDEVTGDSVAVKILRHDFGPISPETFRRFEREGKLLQTLVHPNVVALRDLGADEDQPFLVMDLIGGGTLAGVMREEGTRLRTHRVLRIAKDLCGALRVVHRAGIVHRDLKPSNILIADDGSALLSDFGLAFLSNATRITSSPSVMGTLCYISPEALWGKDVDGRSDLWSLGVLLFQLTTGTVPFGGDSAPQIVHALATADIPKVEEVRPSVPERLCAVINALLKRKREERPDDVEAMYAEVVAMLEAGDFGDVDAARVS